MSKRRKRGKREGWNLNDLNATKITVMIEGSYILICLSVIYMKMKKSIL